MDEGMQVSDIVSSAAGRDKGGLFVIMRLEGLFAYIADGKLRRSENPKKKSLKHLKRVAAGAEPIAGKLLREGKATNSEIRRMLSQHLKLTGGSETGG